MFVFTIVCELVTYSFELVQGNRTRPNTDTDSGNFFGCDSRKIPMELPEECWALIFKALNHHRYHESLSLVSTSFLSLSNRLRSTLTITDETVPFLRELLERFRKLKRVRICASRGNLDYVLMEVLLSRLDLDSIDFSGTGKFPNIEVLGFNMRNLKELHCSGVMGLGNHGLEAIGICFPFLHELDISYLKPRDGPSSIVLTDSAVISLSSKLKSLQKINLSGNWSITDKSLVSLSQNCPFLRKIAVRGCEQITPDGIGYVLRHSPNLESLLASGVGLNLSDTFFGGALPFARALSELNLSSSFLPDEWLRLLAVANLPLKKLKLSCCHFFTFDGLLYLLSRYQALVHLDLEGSGFLTDESIMELRQFIQSLAYLNLSFCSKLTGLAFFSLIENCALLNCVKMEYTNFGVEEFSKELNIKSGLKSLCIAKNFNLSDECLKRVARDCPWLELLDVAQCHSLSGDGVVEVLRNCCKLTHLDINRCRGLKRLNIDFEVPRLEVLRACATLIDDEDLEIISSTCRGLLHLDLEGCLNVTSHGVKEILQNCAGLRELNLKCCANDNPSYDLLLDFLGQLSKRNLKRESCCNIMQFLIRSVKKDKQMEALVEKLCNRFSGVTDTKQWEYISYCLSELTFTEKGIKKLIDSFQTYKHALSVDLVMENFGRIINKGKKFATSELEACIEEFEEKLNKLHMEKKEQEETATSHGTNLRSRPRSDNLHAMEFMD